MASFNKITIVGYLGRDPEIRYTSQGTAVCDFSVATTERRKDKTGEMQEVTTWFRVSLFGRQAEIAHQYLSKGRQVYVEGSLSQREWTDKDGAARTSLEVRGSDIQFLTPAADHEQPQAAVAKAGVSEMREARPTSTTGGNRTPTPSARPASPSSKVAFDEDDIPF
ncbi:MAG: single-stranded DNA-binding protein [Acidobacteria bacterium]|nr:single-stranded DNA-binding protein [Acidobacteriota bacterium]